MPEFTVTAALKKKDTPDKGYGAGQVIGLELLDAGGKQFAPAEWFTKATTQVPVVGSKVEFESPEWDDKFKVWKVKKPKGNFGGAGRGGRSPEESRQIVRQHSQHMALKYYEVRGEGVPSTFNALEQMVDWFYQDALNAQPPKVQPTRKDTERDPNYTTDVPADTQGLAA